MALMLLYIHGFNSTSGSGKAQELKKWLEAQGRGNEWACPDLPHQPAAAIAELSRVIESAKSPVKLIGSSLGGFYATWLAEQLGCRAVLLNPAIKPFDDLRAYIGAQTVYGSDASIDFKPQYLEELQAIDTPAITRPERYYLIAATGDELIDYRTMLAKYADAKHTVIQGSDHQISDFSRHLDDVLAFCGVS
jgi:predicted esterase YcpF (UPF0227 family)